MNENFKINTAEIDRFKFLNKEEKNFRLNNLKLFNTQGFPTKNDEDWKFSDVKQIFSKNFKNLEAWNKEVSPKSINLIKDFDHNYILLINGKFEKSDFKFEDKNKIKVKSNKNTNFSQDNKKNTLINLNNALSNNGLFLEVENNYKFEKVLIIYNVFTNDLNNNLLNNKNRIIVGKNSELHIIEYNINQSSKKFINNTTESILLNENAILKTINLQENKNYGFFINLLKARCNTIQIILDLFFHQVQSLTKLICNLILKEKIVIVV